MKRPRSPILSAIYLAELAISQLSRIELDDPKRDEAFQRVIDWIKKQEGEVNEDFGN